MSDFKSAGPQHLQLHCVGAFSTRQPDSSPCDGLPRRLYWIHLVTFWTWTQSGKGREHGDGGGGWCGENNEASQNFSKTASPPNRHNASLWGLNVADCVCWRIWKEEGGEACDVWSWPDCDKKKKLQKNWFVVWIEQDVQDVSDVTSEADLCFWDGRQEVAPGGWEVTECCCECVSFNTHKHLNTRVLSQNW